MIFFHVIAKLILADFIVFDRCAGIPRGGGVLPIVGNTGRLRPKVKVEEMVAKAKYIRGCPFLKEINTQLNQND